MTSEEKDQIRENIIDSACQMFGKFGYKKTTMDDIALYAKKGKTAIYYYYKNKDEIFAAVIEKEAQKLSWEIVNAIAKQKNPIDKLKAYIFVRMDTLQHVSVYYDAMKNELFDQLNFINQIREKYEKEELKLVKIILTEGVNKNHFKVKNITSTAETIVTVLKSLEIPYFAQSKQKTLDKKLKNLVDLMFKGILK